MGLVNSVGSRAMRPPNPPSYGLEADGDGWRFTSPPLDYGCAAWSPQNNYANGCPIGFPGARKARSSHLAHTVTKRRSAETGRDIALLRVYSTEPSATRPTLLYSKGNSFDMGMLRYHCVQLAQLLDVDVVYYDYGGYGASSGSPSAAGTSSVPKKEQTHGWRRHASTLVSRRNASSSFSRSRRIVSTLTATGVPRQSPR